MKSDQTDLCNLRKRNLKKKNLYLQTRKRKINKWKMIIVMETQNHFLRKIYHKSSSIRSILIIKIIIHMVDLRWKDGPNSLMLLKWVLVSYLIINFQCYSLGNSTVPKLLIIWSIGISWKICTISKMMSMKILKQIVKRQEMQHAKSFLMLLWENRLRRPWIRKRSRKKGLKMSSLNKCNQRSILSNLNSWNKWNPNPSPSPRKRKLLNQLKVQVLEKRKRRKRNLRKYRMIPKKYVDE